MQHSALGAREEKRRFWSEHLSRWEASGLTQREYCHQHDLKPHCFMYWRKKQRTRAESTTCLVERGRFFQKELFGRKTEKHSVRSQGVQLHLFNEAEALLQEQDEKPLKVPAHTRRRPKRKPLPADLPRLDVVHDIAEDEKRCSCGLQAFVVFGAALLEVVRQIEHRLGE